MELWKFIGWMDGMQSKHDLTIYDRAVFEELLEHARGKKVCHPSTKRMADRRKIAERTVQRSIARLTEKELISVEYREGSSNEYTIHVDPRLSDTPDSESPLSESHPRLRVVRRSTTTSQEKSDGTRKKNKDPRHRVTPVREAPPKRTVKTGKPPIPEQPTKKEIARYFELGYFTYNAAANRFVNNDGNFSVEQLRAHEGDDEWWEETRKNHLREGRRMERESKR